MLAAVETGRVPTIVTHDGDGCGACPTTSKALSASPATAASPSPVRPLAVRRSRLAACFRGHGAVRVETLARIPQPLRAAIARCDRHHPVSAT
jgi:hypothetical protein